MDIFQMTALECGAAIKDGRLTAVQAAEQAIAAAKADKTNAYITVCGEQALAQAAEVQKQIEAGT